MIAEHGIDVRVPFVGRAGQLEQALALLRTGGIVTLVGPGGSGKSRLALELAHRSAGDDFAFVPLLEIGTGAVADAVAAALGARESAGETAFDAAVAQLRGRPRLVLIDNAEHVLGEARSAAEAIAAASEAVVLVTSRHRLGARGEAIVEVGAMPLPDAQTFFVSCVRTRIAGFAPDARERASIDKIVTLLDGLPFAIDLATAHYPAKSLGQLVETARRIVPARLNAKTSSDSRHCTLQQTIDWSTSLLGERARDALGCLTTFNGRFDVQDARALYAPDEPVEIVADLLTELVDHSLLMRASDGSYAMLAPIRAAARPLLSGTAQRRTISKRFAARMRDVANAMRARIETGNSANGISAIAQRYADFRAVMEWSIKSSDRLPLGVEISWLLVARWADGGHLTEGMTWTKRLTDAAQKTGVLDSYALAKLWYARMRVCILASDYPTLIEHSSFLVGAFTQANDQLSLGRAYNALGVASLYTGDLDNALRYSEMALRLHTAIGHRRGVASALCNMGSIELELRDCPAQALEYYLKGEELSRAERFDGLLVTLLGNLAETYCVLQHYLKLEEVIAEGLALAAGLDNAAFQSWLNATLARGRLASGDRQGARRALERALDLLETTQQPEYLAATVETVARYVLLAGQPGEAARLIRAVQRHRERFRLLTFGPTVDGARQTGEQARDRLSREDGEAALGAGDRVSSADLRAVAKTVLRNASSRYDSHGSPVTHSSQLQEQDLGRTSG
ncbi:MAG TPA: AAA family ATPase [Verrucomicrobiae bacterium]|nr:AAA family ATPase [Verrucomicrobiae bacterium]